MRGGSREKPIESVPAPYSFFVRQKKNRGRKKDARVARAAPLDPLQAVETARQAVMLEFAIWRPAQATGSTITLSIDRFRKACPGKMNFGDTRRTHIDQNLLLRLSWSRRKRLK